MSAPRCARPEELPDFRLWLAEQWRPGRLYYETSARIQAARHVPSRDRSSPSDPANYAHWEQTTLEGAQLWWVAEDMVDLLLAAASGMPDDLRYDDLHLPAPQGLLLFAKPWLGQDAEVKGHQVEVDAMAWGGTNLPPLPDRVWHPEQHTPSGTRALSISVYRRINYDDGLRAEEMQLAAAHGLFSTTAAGHATLARLERLDDRGLNALMHGYDWMPLGRSDWPVMDPIGQEPWPMSEQGRLSYVEDRKVLAAFFTLIEQEGITSRTMHRDRPAQRRTVRAGLPAEAADVRIVRLRRPKTEHTPSGDATGREHDYRWLVTGHWRWQPVGPGRAERRLTYVRPHVKGPADKPLKVHERVNYWIR